MSKLPEPEDLPANEIICEIYCHIIFWTRRLEPVLTPQVLSGICQEMDQAMFTVEGEALAAGGSDNHLHILARLSPNHSLQNVLDAMRARSQAWIAKECGPARFSWHQDEVAATLGLEDLPKAKDFINSQQTHHEAVSFQSELKDIFLELGFTYNEKELFS